MNQPHTLFSLSGGLKTWIFLGAALISFQSAFAQEGDATEGEPVATASVTAEAVEVVEQAGELSAIVDRIFDTLNGPMIAVLFFPVGPFPFIVLWLVLAAVFFSIRMGFINFKAFRHAVDVVRGKYDDPDAEGEVTHFQALTAALSATVGLGNIAGVAIAVSLGGPGATFWMILAGLLGMNSKFAECTAGQMYREVRPDGHVMGGAMFYLSKGFAEKGWAPIGKALAGLFVILCVGASLGGGNAFQVNQSFNAVAEATSNLTGTPLEAVKSYGWVYGLLMAGLVFLVIVGGIKSIATAAEKIVPTMCGIYVLACLIILFKNFGAIPGAFATIISGAFTPEAGYGGLIGVLVMGFKRAAFSNEAGIGSAPIAHAAAKTPYPVREGIVALLEPFIDTIVVCTMTALVIVITGAYNNPEYAEIIKAEQGAALTSKAFGAEIAFFPYILAIAVVLFAFSTMISWSYYGERCWSYLFGDGTSMIYKILFCLVVFLGAIASSGKVLLFSDLMLLGMAFPNVIGVILVSGKIRTALDSYMSDLAAGKFKAFRN